MPTGLEYLPRHWRVVPVRGKIPLGHNWPAKALTVADAESVRPPKNAEGWGLVLGPSSGVIDLETDGPEGEATYSKLVQGNPPICPCWKSPRGKHRLFQWHPMLENLPAAIHLGPGLELRVGHDKAHSTLPPVQGRHWLVIPLDVDPPPLPEPILALALSKLAPAHRPYTAPIPEIPQGARNTTLTSVAGFLRRKGATLEIILQALRELNHIWCSPPLPDKEIQAIAKSISKYPANEYPPPALPDSSQCPAPAIGHLLDKEAKLASVLNQLWHNLYRWDSYQKSWRKFIGTHWQLISQERVVAEAQATLCTHFHAELQIAQAANAPEEDIDQIRRWLSQSQSVLMVQRALQLLCGMDGFFTSPEQWDANPALLNTLSGTYNLMDNELLPHSPEMLLTKLAPTHIGDPEGGIRWLQHLEMCLPNPDIRAQLQYDLGAALYGAHIRDIFCVWYGVGANGKTTTMRVIQAVLGLNLAGSFTGYCAQIPASILLRAQFPQHPTGLMTLNKVRLAFATEPPQDCRLDEAAVKLLSGGDPITARLVFRDFTTFLPSHTIILITNHKPELSCDEAALAACTFYPMGRGYPARGPPPRAGDTAAIAGRKCVHPWLDASGLEALPGGSTLEEPIYTDGHKKTSG